LLNWVVIALRKLLLIGVVGNCPTDDSATIEGLVVDLMPQQT
jgi:hypothetical protein